MSHPLVDQLRFTRSEWLRALDDTPEADGLRRLEPMNSIGWIVGHLAWHEQLYWLTRGQGTVLLPALTEQVATGRPATTPPLAEMLDAWHRVTDAADPWLDALTTRRLLEELKGSPVYRTIGSSLLRVTYHYWFHIGEILAIRQVLGHPGLPEFVGDIDAQAPYRSDTAS